MSTTTDITTIKHNNYTARLYVRHTVTGDNASTWVELTSSDGGLRDLPWDSHTGSFGDVLGIPGQRALEDAIEAAREAHLEDGIRASMEGL